VTIRQVGGAVPAKQRYIIVTGSGNTLYGIEQVRPDTPAMLVEGVLDALSVIQEAGDLLAIVAGGTTGGRRERWIGRLSVASTVLVSLDADEAGEAAAAWWLTALGARARRWRPYWGDPNQLLQDGVDLRMWVREGLGGESRWWRKFARWSEDRREQWEERVSIMEMDGMLARHEAEQGAFEQMGET
jgi:hypothetical protein